MSLRKLHQGFTLIEIMVVLVIIGIIVAMASLAISDPAAGKLREENERLAALVRLAQEEAILQSRELGVGFWENGYGFYELIEGEWQTVEQDKILRTREMPNDIQLQLLLEGVEIIMSALPEEKPQIFILSSGEMTPFDIHFVLDEKTQRTLTADALGKIEIADNSETQSL